MYETERSNPLKPKRQGNQINPTMVYILRQYIFFLVHSSVSKPFSRIGGKLHDSDRPARPAETRSYLFRPTCGPRTL